MIVLSVSFDVPFVQHYFAHGLISYHLCSLSWRHSVVVCPRIA